MARIEEIDFLGEKQSGVNVSNTVGIGGVNDKYDVMLIQALFRYIALQEEPAAYGEYDDFARWVLGVTSAKDVPNATGVFDTLTANAVWGFQRRNELRLLSVDGVIHPADYNGRVLKKQYPLMTITLLHAEALGTITNIGKNYIEGLRIIAPQLPI